MDAVTIGAAVALTGGAATRANEAAQRANEAAQEAEQATEGFTFLKTDAEIDRTALNYIITAIEAELMDTRKRLIVAETKLDALT